MAAVIGYLRSEPAILQGLLTAAVAIAAHFGFNWSPEIVAIVTAAFGVASSQVVRASVTPIAAPVVVPH